MNLPTGIDKVGELVIKDGWNHVEVLCDDANRNVTWIGIHVYKNKQENTIEDDQFTDSNPGKKKAAAADDMHEINRKNYPFLKKYCPLLDMEFFDIHSFPRSLDSQGELWKMQAAAKVKALVWQIYLECLPTCEYLFKRALVNSQLCPICEIEYETIEHVFLICAWTRAVWFASDLRWGIDVERYDSFTEWLRDRIDEIRTVHPDTYKIHGIVGSVFWAIWKGRNEYILEGKPVDPALASFRAKNLHNQYSHRYPLNHTTFNSTTATTYQGTARNFLLIKPKISIYDI